MIQILYYLKDPKLWELWYIPYSQYCRISLINRIAKTPWDLENPEALRSEHHGILLRLFEILRMSLQAFA